MINARKLVRTIQSELPALRQPKHWLQHSFHALTRTPHDPDFGALRLLPQAEDDLFLDIGANRGQSIASIRLLRPQVRLIGFEPNPTLAKALARRARRDPSLEIRPYGLGERAGSFRLYIPSYNGWVYDGLASLDRREAAEWIGPETVYRYRRSLLHIEERVCEVRTLDAERLCPSFIKIDVQGLEYAVLKGGIETLRRSLPILLVEAFGGDARLRDLLFDLGYRPHSYDGGRLAPVPSRTPNTFLIPPGRLPPALAA